MKWFIDFFDLQWLINLWYDKTEFEWWQMLLIGMFFLFANSVISAAMCYVRVAIVKEYGYSKKQKKKGKKIVMKKPNLYDYIFLVRITRDANNKGFILYLNIFCHYINLISFVVSLFGFFACMVTLGDGWAIILLIFPVFGALAITTVLEFVPHIIWLPSVRRKYSL